MIKTRQISKIIQVMFTEGWAFISKNTFEKICQSQIGSLLAKGVKISKHLVKPPPPEEALTFISMLAIVEEILNPQAFQRFLLQGGPLLLLVISRAITPTIN